MTKNCVFRDEAGIGPTMKDWTVRGVAALMIGATLLASSGCVPLVAAGAAVGGMAAIDRRSVGAQTEDQSIELSAQSRLSSAIAKGQSVSVTSFNRKVLLSGFVNDDEQKALAEKAVAGVQNVRSIHNELQVGFKPSLARSTNDAALTARVRASLIEARDLQSNIFKVVTESGVVYLMGIVTQREGDRGAQVASIVPNVTRVVTLFEYVSEGELVNLRTPNSTEAPRSAR
ncbi:MAG: BON domain-containing protein [Burkholderiaceae bacterium]